MPEKHVLIRCRFLVIQTIHHETPFIIDAQAFRGADSRISDCHVFMRRRRRYTRRRHEPIQTNCDNVHALVRQRYLQLFQAQYRGVRDCHNGQQGTGWQLTCSVYI